MSDSDNKIHIAEPVGDWGDHVVAANTSTIPPAELDRMTDDIINALKTVFDPEIPADIYELGLVYKIDIEDDRTVKIDMTLTAPGCPVAGDMPSWVENAVGAVEAGRRGLFIIKSSIQPTFVMLYRLDIEKCDLSIKGKRVEKTEF